jgi:hypothetical protein
MVEKTEVTTLQIRNIEKPRKSPFLRIPISSNQIIPEKYPPIM